MNVQFIDSPRGNYIDAENQSPKVSIWIAPEEKPAVSYSIYYQLFMYNYSQYFNRHKLRR